MRQTQKRVLVIGLDGGTFDLIERWVAKGHLPNLASLMSTGCRGQLASTLQPTTAPAWVTFMTGANQGKHGLYDFVRRRPGEYGLMVTNASQIALPTIFDIVSRAGRRAVTVNLPYTSPPRPLNGVAIGGPFAPAVTRDMIYPPSYYDTVKAVVPDYFILPDYEPLAADPLMTYARKLLHGIALRERLTLHLLDTEPWDLFTVVFMATDQAQHTYWRFQDAAENSPMTRYRHVIRDVYQRVDRAIGAILSQVAASSNGRETTVIIMSDHGAGSLRYMINLNRWLAEAGYLRYRTDRLDRLRQLWTDGIKGLIRAYRHYAPSRVRALVRARLGAGRFNRIKGDVESALLTLSVDWERTSAYALGAGGNIFVNLEGREPAGIVKPGDEYERLCQEIAHKLTSLQDPDSGRALVRRVYRREELYSGPYTDQAPDLVIQWDDYSCWGRGRYDSRGTQIFEEKRSFDLGELPLSGSHRPQGILVLNGPGTLAGTRTRGARIHDLAPTILGLLDLPIPQYMDGRVLLEAFAKDTIKRTISAPDDAIDPSVGDGMDYTSEEEAQISQHLKNLGYL